MKRIIAAALALAFAAPVAAQEWVTISSNQSAIYDALAGSLQHSFTAQTKDPIVAVTIRVTVRESRQVLFERNYVRVADCQAGQGKIVTVDLNGRAKYDNDFIFGGGNSASNIARVICEVAFPGTTSAPAPAPEEEPRSVRRGEVRL
jgi:hypothetical protein